MWLVWLRQQPLFWNPRKKIAVANSYHIVARVVLVDHKVLHAPLKGEGERVAEAALCDADQVCAACRAS